jgi:hypothetical protein
MARRWSGNLSIHIKFVDRDNQYKATVCRIAPNRAERDCQVMWVGPPAHLTRAVDSPAAYDDAARAAIAFLDDEGRLPGRAEWGDSDIVVRRKRR